ncbi:hypothetical protein CR513_42198, partial [Mucuna pruriens]
MCDASNFGIGSRLRLESWSRQTSARDCLCVPNNGPNLILAEEAKSKVETDLVDASPPRIPHRNQRQEGC